MTHSVLVETAQQVCGVVLPESGRRATVWAMPCSEGQRRLKDDASRGRVFGEDELRLEDWFVPVLYQEKDDPLLFQAIPIPTDPRGCTNPPRRADGRTAADTGNWICRAQPRTAGAPAAPADASVMPWCADRAARARPRWRPSSPAGWCVPSRYAAPRSFPSSPMGKLRAVVDALGRQLVGDGLLRGRRSRYAIKGVELALHEQETLLVVDNMEKILLPPFMAEETPEALTEDARRELDAILVLCERLLKAGETRMIYISREALPAPFDGERNRLGLGRG